MRPTRLAAPSPLSVRDTVSQVVGYQVTRKESERGVHGTTPGGEGPT